VLSLKKCLLKQKKKKHGGLKCHLTKRCFTVLKRKDCGRCKNCLVSHVKCLYGKKCTKECVWKHFQECVLKRLPPTLVRWCGKHFL